MILIKDVFYWRAIFDTMATVVVSLTFSPLYTQIMELEYSSQTNGRYFTFSAVLDVKKCYIILAPKMHFASFAMLVTGKSLSEAFLFSEHGEIMLCTKIVLNVRNNFCTQFVLPRFELGIFMYWTCNSMNNLSSYFGLVDAK